MGRPGRDPQAPVAVGGEGAGGGQGPALAGGPVAGVDGDRGSVRRARGPQASARPDPPQGSGPDAGGGGGGGGPGAVHPRGPRPHRRGPGGGPGGRGGRPGGRGAGGRRGGGGPAR